MRSIVLLLTAFQLLQFLINPLQIHARIVTGTDPSKSSQLAHIYMENESLDMQVDRIVDILSTREMIAELIMTSCGEHGRDFDSTATLIRNSSAGGVLFLGVTSEEIWEYTKRLTDISALSDPLLPLFAIDGEPLLLHERVTDLPSIPGAATIQTPEQAREIALYVTMVLRGLGIHINYAPVCDYSLNREVIGNRSFGSDYERVSTLSGVFISTMQGEGVVATAKHFPGHGTVEGDSHQELLFIDGDPPELPVFQDAIDGNVISIMVGHIGVQNSFRYGTEGKPSSLSRIMVTQVLKEELGFKGIVVSDALNMQAVSSFDAPAFQALKAGCDMVLMPEDEVALIDRVHYEMGIDHSFRQQIEESVRKVVRLKLILGLINEKELEKMAQFDDIY